MKSGRFLKSTKTVDRKQHPKPRNLDQRGQASLLVAAMLITFIAFFTFVVNVGILVNAKINLQNAADLAAYAGAATQARQLNRISYLNYEMRRQYKKFLYRYYVIGGMSQKSHNDSVSRADRNPRVWSPTGLAQDNLQVPAVCLIFNKTDNPCQVLSTAKIDASKIPLNPLDSISNALRGQFQALDNIRQEACEYQSLTNEWTLGQWLFNTDWDNSQLQQDLQNAAATDPKAQKFAEVGRTVFALTQGLGLIPRLTLHRRRIETLGYYLNFPGQRGLDFDSAQNLAKQGDPAARERTINAFFSAYRTLGEHTFPQDGITFDELLPPASVGVYKHQPIKATFEAYSFNNAPSRTGDCEGIPKAIRVEDLTVGVYKDPSILTFYGVKLSAQANILFWPGARPARLTAYAMAQPFGSRIGPPPEVLGERAFVREVRPRRSCGGTQLDCTGVPNLRVFGESDDLSLGWNTNHVISTMFRAMGNLGDPTPSNINQERLRLGLAAAMAPNPFERGLYNTLYEGDSLESDPGHQNSGDPFNKIFEVDAGTQQLRATFWAPIISVDEGGGADDEIKQYIQDSLPPSLLAIPNLGEKYADNIVRYIGNLRAGQALEDGETYNNFTVVEPYRRLERNQPVVIAQNDNQVFLSPENLADVRTSWNNIDKTRLIARGRSGYSVKLVAFSTLRQNIGEIQSYPFLGPKEAISNTQNLDGGSALANELDLIRH